MRTGVLRRALPAALSGGLALLTTVVPVTAARVLPAPRWLHPIDGVSHITLGWTHVRGAYDYFVYQGDRYIGRSRTTSLLDRNVQSDSSYTFRVRACTRSVCDGYSGPIQITTYMSEQDAMTAVSPFVVRVSTYSNDLGGGVVTGTGWYVTNDLIVTAYHVVMNAHLFIDVLVPGSEDVQHAQVVAKDPTHDIAILKLANASADPGGNLRTAPYAEAAQLTTSEPTYLVGYPGGGPETTTTGHVVATGQQVPYADQAPAVAFTGYDFINDTAYTAPGNSGGPLVDPWGQVIGVAVAGNPAGGQVSWETPVMFVEQLISQFGLS